jgi:hypothetical protein
MTTLVAIFAFLIGVIATSAFYRNQIREASATASELERDVIRAAMQCGGRITAIDVRETHGRSLADVEEQLRRLHARGYCESDVTNEGQVVYVFPAFDEAPRRALRIESQILQLARARNGLVDVSKIAADTELSYLEARSLLDRMCDAGICEPTERSDTYRFFPERERLGQ